MRNKIVFIIILVSAIGGLGAFSKVLSTKSNTKALRYKPYSFTDRDHAELTITKFIRAIDDGDLRYASLLIDEDAKRNEIYKLIREFCDKRQKDKNKRYLAIQPIEFVFNDSVIGMLCKIKNLLRLGETKQGMLNVVKKGNEWLIAPSSEFFRLLKDCNEKTKQTLEGAK